MKFTLSWLKDYLDTTATIDEICDGLVGVGLEVEDVSDMTKALAPFKVGYVQHAEKHPNADKLRLCKVETDTGMIQVVCGAPNARTGIKGIIALPGHYIPGTKITLETGVIRGSESQGMLCSERELLISDEHNGIIEVDESWPIGTPAATALGLDDPMIYVKVTPNRPDALGIYGIARDLAAKGLGTLKPLDAKPVAGTFESPIKVSLDFENGDTKPCPLFVGRHIRGVKNGPSPQWLQRRLKAIGLRPISTLVDITNYITFAYGRPLHVFDAAKVKGSIRARLATDGETLEALDNKTYTLTPAMTVIADDAGPEAIAGIIGGIPSSCTEETTDVFLEAAYFDPLAHRSHGPQARHHVGCALPLRARRRSGLHADWRRDRHAHDPRTLRRRGLAHRHGGCRAQHVPHLQLAQVTRGIARGRRYSRNEPKGHPLPRSAMA
jgi:phenylalanyl-tRNA synthetase beta chain